ncbi:phage minor head protein [Roseibium sp.]|uniref:phage head morphogenesis protein n=1 Tax=Roseibium sp. TaxID=1936156 RepID=UPI003D105D46
MADGFRFGAGPAPEVLAYLDGRGLSQSFDWRDNYGADHAYAFTVAKATQVEVLSGIHDEVQRAIREGLPFDAFRKSLAPKLKKLGWWGKRAEIDPKTGETVISQLGSNRRLKTIYWANTRTAYGAGKWTRIQRTKAALPYLIYRLGSAREHRPHHADKENIILPVDHPFWTTWYPPNGWGCVCWVRQITQAEAESLGGVTDPPEIATTPWTNKRTGETRDIPVGIDPGWDSNPGKERHRTLAKHLAGHLDAAPDHIRRAAMTDLVGSQAFRRVANGELAGHTVFAPAAVVPESVATAMGSTTRVAFLSTADAAKQLGKGRAFGPEFYTNVQALLDSGEIRADRSRKDSTDFAAAGLIGGAWWRVVFRVTKAGDEIFLKSFRRSSENQIESYRKRGEQLSN